MGKQVYEMQNFVKLTKAKSNVGPTIYKVYDHKDDLVEWRQDSGWVDTK